MDNFFNQASLKNPILPRPGILYPRDPPSPEFHPCAPINDVKIHQFPTKSGRGEGGSRGYKNIFEPPRHYSGDRIIPLRALHTATETPVTRGTTRHSRDHEPLCTLYPRDPPNPLLKTRKQINRILDKKFQALPHDPAQHLLFLGADAPVIRRRRVGIVLLSLL